MPAEPTSQTSNPRPHWVRYGIAADQKYLTGPFAETYDQLVINGNMLAYMKSALSQFITQTARKPFVVDPQTHAFAHDLEFLMSDSKGSAGKIKRSWQKLIDAYGDGLANIIGKGRPLDPEDFGNEMFATDFVGRVLEFQRDSVSRELQEGEDREYLEFLAAETGETPWIQPPTYLIAPYFFVGGPFATEWHKVNIRLAREAKQYVDTQTNPQPELVAQLVISKEILMDEFFVEALIKDYATLGLSTVLLWIDDFSEHRASKKELERYVELLKGFSSKSMGVVNLFGGFFSIALMRFSESCRGALKGVCHGLEYGEVRPVIPLGGGTPVARFYSRNLHHRLPPRTARQEMLLLNALLSADSFHSEICCCPNCQSVIQHNPRVEVEAYFDFKESTYWVGSRRVSREFPTALASDNCTRHYMWCKAWEYSQLLLSIDMLCDQLIDADGKFRKELGADHAGHAKVWAEVLSANL